MRKFSAFIIAATILLSGAAAFAAGGDKVEYKKRTVIDFSDAVIEGELTKPEGAYIVNRKVSNFSSLIRVRENFIPELLSSSDNL